MSDLPPNPGAAAAVDDISLDFLDEAANNHVPPNPPGVNELGPELQDRFWQLKEMLHSAVLVKDEHITGCLLADPVEANLDVLADRIITESLIKGGAAAAADEGESSAVSKIKSGAIGVTVPDSAEALCARFREMMTRLSMENLKELVKEYFVVLRIREAERLYSVVDILVDYAIADPRSCGVFAKFAKFICECELRRNNARSRFRELLVASCQKSFQQIPEVAEKVKGMSRSELEEFVSQNGFQRMNGTMTFIGELFKQSLLAGGIVYSCINKLLQSVQIHGEIITEAFIHLLATLRKALEKPFALHSQQSPQYLHIHNIKRALGNNWHMELPVIRPDVSPRLQFTIDDLLQLRERSMHAIRRVDSTSFSSREVFAAVIGGCEASAAKASFPDVIIHCGEKIFNCHRVILSQRSATFREIFCSNPADRPTEPIIVGDVDEGILAEMLRFIYCGYVDTDVARAPLEVQHEFLRAAEKLHLTGLIEHLWNALLENVDVRSACRLLLWADCFDLDRLKVECFKVMAKAANRSLVMGALEWDELCGNKDLLTQFYCFDPAPPTAIGGSAAEAMDVVVDTAGANGNFVQFMLSIKSQDNTPSQSFSFRPVFSLVLDPSSAKASLSDVQLNCDDTTFNCHRLVLAEKSSTFQTMFTGDFAEGNKEPVIIDDITGETMGEILRFIYCGYVETDVAQATPEAQYEFLYAAVKYDLRTLVDFLLIAFLENLNPQTACRYFIWADRFSLPGLKTSCYDVMRQQANREAVASSAEWQEVVGNKQFINELFRST